MTPLGLAGLTRGEATLEARRGSDTGLIEPRDRRIDAELRRQVHSLENYAAALWSSA